MTIKITDRKVLFSALLFVVFVYYIHLLGIFLQTNLWWVFLTLIYIAVFISRDMVLKNESFRNNLKIKPRREIRIDFWN